MTNMPTSQAPGREESEKIFDRIYSSLTTKTGTDDNGNETRYPGTYKELKILRAGVAKLRQIGCRDEDVVQRTSQLAAMAEEASRRQFSGSAKLLVLALVGILGLSYCSNPVFNSKELTESAAKAEMERRISSWKDAISANENDLKDLQISDSMKVTKKAYIAGAEDTVKQLESMTPKEYMDAHNSTIPMKKAKGVVTFIVLLCFPLAYFFSARAPVFLLVKRRMTLERWKVGWGFLGAMLFGILTYFSSIPVTTTITHWSDGSKTESDDSTDLASLQMAALAVVAIVLLFVIVYIMPLMTIGNLIRNYGFLLVEKIRKEPEPSFD